MGRPLRVEAAGYAYHVLNRGNGRMRIFRGDHDYAAFERILEEAVEREPDMRLIAYCLMPNHWHMVLQPRADGILSSFVGWLTLTHTQRWHASRGSTGGGHVYQGRFKSFLIEMETYLAAACRYVERNPVRAGLVRKAENWRWSSLHRWARGDAEARAILSPWPVESERAGRGERGALRPAGWLAKVNRPESAAERDSMEQTIQRGRPLGSESWTSRIIKRFELQSTIRPQGRPRKVKGPAATSKKPLRKRTRTSTR